jgi:hypothetical protein
MVKELSTKLLGSKVIELATDSDKIDTYSLCASKHEAWIYVTDEDEDGVPNAQDDSIIVAFTALDSSGAGCIDEIFDGVITFLTDPEEWQSTVDTGYDIIWEKYDNCGGDGLIFSDCFDKGLAAGLYTGVYGITTAGSYIGQGTAYVVSGAYNATKDAVCGKYNPFCAEDESDYIRRMVLKADSSQSEVTSCNPLDGEFYGTAYHNSNGGEHKVKITINKLYQGKTTTVYQSELSGSDSYKKKEGALLFEPAYRKFKLNGPGTYTITVQSLAANMDCGNPSLDLTTSVVVAESPDAGTIENTVSTLTEGITDITEATGARPLYIYGGAVLLGGLLISKYLKLLSGSGDDSESE